MKNRKTPAQCLDVSGKALFVSAKALCRTVPAGKAMR